MVIHKFGGSVLKTLEDIYNFINIIKNDKTKKLIVISAFNKVTLLLEKLYLSSNENYFTIFFDYHLYMISNLKDTNYEKALNILLFCKEKIYNILRNKKNTDRQLAATLSYGEYLSSNIIYLYLQEEKINSIWINSCDIIKTDDSYLNANVKEDISQEKADILLKPLLENYDIVITQGFISQYFDDKNNNNIITTLGKEGSDYSTALFAKFLNVKSIILWKDVLGLSTGDPKIFNNTIPLKELSYEELETMSFLGAKIVHYKTIGILKKQNITLEIRNLYHSSQAFTSVYSKSSTNNLLKYILKINQRIVIITKFEIINEYEFYYILKVISYLKITKFKYNSFYIAIILNNDIFIDEEIQKLKKYFYVYDINNMKLLTIINPPKNYDIKSLFSKNQIFTENFQKNIDIKRYMLLEKEKKLFMILF